MASLRKSTGQSQNRCVQVRKCLIDSKRVEQGKSLLGSKSLLLVFSATILRSLTSARNYATIADRKSKIRQGTNGQKTNVGKQGAAGKAAADPKRFSGDGSATAALSGRVFLFSLGAWACLRRRAAPPLSSLTSSRLTATCFYLCR